MKSDFDIIVIGGGHAGVEAALAAAKMGKEVALISMDARKLALMSCNPAIGGIGKSQLVKEIDALGGIMGEAIDETGIQFRRLNLSKGPAVWSTRAQADRRLYNQFVVDYIISHKGIEVVEGLVDEILAEKGRTTGIRLSSGEKINGLAVIVTTGTFLGAQIHIGEKCSSAGRFGEKSAEKLSESFLSFGFELGRLKTGTPPRLDGDSIDWSKCELQPGETPIPYFSIRSNRGDFEQIPCHLTRTTDQTRKIILENLEKSPMFTGQIKGVGPRYCPSIEDKFFRFKDKPSHQIFLEPEGNGTNEVYPNGFSTSLPESVQRKAMRTVIGLEDVNIIRPGYAVEYDYCPAFQIKPSLETRSLSGLFLAGQINGTSGYEEAAAQGLMAGINAALQISGEEPFILSRSEAYIGVMIDDLISRSTTEPYRMFTSRAEYRLALREDNAYDRLFGYAHKLGLIRDKEFQDLKELQKDTELLLSRLNSIRVNSELLPSGLSDRFKKSKYLPLADLFKLPNVSLDMVRELLDSKLPEYAGKTAIMKRAAIKLRYQGYIDKQSRQIERFKRLEKERIPENFSYSDIVGLKREATEKFERFRPVSLGQAGRIEGVTPGDVAVLSIYLKKSREAK